mmetsp:Transcript_23518/g.61869  ORF Transcript_23518/g.61869 Transcript_23518/m.61869 type:complete len:201 (+) Transcript_23518:645-1247(+)
MMRQFRLKGLCLYTCRTRRLVREGVYVGSATVTEQNRGTCFHVGRRTTGEGLPATDAIRSLDSDVVGYAEKIGNVLCGQKPRYSPSTDATPQTPTVARAHPDAGMSNFPSTSSSGGTWRLGRVDLGIIWPGNRQHLNAWTDLGHKERTIPDRLDGTIHAWNCHQRRGNALTVSYQDEVAVADGATVEVLQKPTNKAHSSF